MRAALLLALLLALPALGHGYVTKDLPPERVDISLTYNGKDIFFAGEAPREADIYIKVSGGSGDKIELSEKGKVGVFWMTTRRAVVEGMPRLLLIYSTSDISALPKGLQDELGIDEAYSQLRSEARVMEEGEAKMEIKGEERERFIEGLIRIKEGQGLYAVKEGAVDMRGDRYEAVLHIPPTASVGSEMVDVYIVKGGEILEYQRRALIIENAGIGGWLTEMAEESSLLYGLLAVMVALSAGLTVGVLFKGGGSH